MGKEQDGGVSGGCPETVDMPSMVYHPTHTYYPLVLFLSDQSTPPLQHQYETRCEPNDDDDDDDESLIACLPGIADGKRHHICTGTQTV